VVVRGDDWTGTLRENLDPLGHHDSEQIWQALDHAHLKAFVAQQGLGLSLAIQPSKQQQWTQWIAVAGRG
jgi:ABC-type multidrug transport system fused ATPase/permease subunit